MNAIVKIGQKIRQVLTLCGQGNVVLERTWHKQSRPQFEINAHVKFNTDLMKGIQVVAQLEDRGDVRASANPLFKLYRVAENSWAETFIDDFVPVEFSHGVWSRGIDQSDIDPNELSGREVYVVEVYLSRKRRTYKKKFWVNHLGAFDSIWRLKRAAEQHEILKLDE
jgi:hypothetical protein